MGVTSVTGAALGGIGLMLLYNFPDAQAVLFVIIGVGAILLARNPNGLAIYLFRLGRWLTGQARAAAAVEPAGAPAARTPETSANPRHETTTTSL